MTCAARQTVTMVTLIERYYFIKIFSVLQCGGFVRLMDFVLDCCTNVHGHRQSVKDELNKLVQFNVDGVLCDLLVDY
jgi:hypothetical protein